MLTFAHPLWLLALPLAFVFVWRWPRRRLPTLRFSHPALLDGLPRGRAAWVPKASFVLRLLTIVLLIVAAAGPRTPDGKTRLPVDGIAIAIVVDVSGSMAEPDYPMPTGTPTSRLDAARLTFGRFVEGTDEMDGMKFSGRPNDLITVVAFAAWPETVCPPTLNRGVVTEIVKKLKPKAGADSGTNIGDALAEALVRLESTGPRRKVIVLLSDGEHNISLDRGDPPLKPRQAAQLAVDLGIPIYAIDCGGAVTNDADAIERRAAGQQTMTSIATMTGGQVFRADDAERLQQAVQTIDRLEQRPAESFRYRRFFEWDVWCGVAAIAMLLGLVAVEMLFAREIP